MTLLARRRVIGRQAMISHVTLEKGCFVPMHSHANEQFVCVLEGRMRFRLGRPAGGDPRVPPAGGSEEVILSAGQVLLLPSDLPHEAEALERTTVLDVFSPPSAETGIDRFGKGGHP
jgi:quercetin dioxygenase-like cupin family protein